MKMLSISLKPKVKKGLHKIIKEEGVFILLLTVSEPSMKKGLHNKIKEERLLMSFSTSCK